MDRAFVRQRVENGNTGCGFRKDALMHFGDREGETKA